MSHIKRIAASALTLVMTVGMIPVTAFAYSSEDGWVEKDGKWYYYSDGMKVKSNTVYNDVDDCYYLLDESGVRVTKSGWVSTKTQYSSYTKNKFKATFKYYLGANGKVTFGWKKISKKWYFFDSNGAMQAGTAEERFDESTGKAKLWLLGNDGKRITKKGWHQVKYNYYDNEGNNTTHKIWYYVNSSGNCVTGLKKIGKKKYCFNDYGVMITNSYIRVVDKSGKEKYYLADKNGVQVTKKGWKSVKYSSKSKFYAYSSEYKATEWFYVNKDGTLATGLKKIKNTYYLFNPEMQVNNVYYKESKDHKTYTEYHFGRSGACKKIITGTVEYC